MMCNYDEELVKALRNNAEHFMTTDYEWSNALVHLLLDSADAIEQKKERAEMIGLDGNICYLPNTLRQIVISNPNMGAFKKETLCKAADAIEELLAKVPQWISVEERLPKGSEYTIVFCADGDRRHVTFAKYLKTPKRWELNGARSYWRVLKWMPLPAPPKGVE